MSFDNNDNIKNKKLIDFIYLHLYWVYYYCTIRHILQYSRYTKIFRSKRNNVAACKCNNRWRCNRRKHDKRSRKKRLCTDNKREQTKREGTLEIACNYCDITRTSNYYRLLLKNCLGMWRRPAIDFLSLPRFLCVQQSRM